MLLAAVVRCLFVVGCFVVFRCVLIVVCLFVDCSYVLRVVFWLVAAARFLLFDVCCKKLCVVMLVVL